jgi:hypothetical protein
MRIMFREGKNLHPNQSKKYYFNILGVCPRNTAVILK